MLEIANNKVKNINEAEWVEWVFSRCLGLWSDGSVAFDRSSVAGSSVSNSRFPSSPVPAYGPVTLFTPVPTCTSWTVWLLKCATILRLTLCWGLAFLCATRSLLIRLSFFTIPWMSWQVFYAPNQECQQPCAHYFQVLRAATWAHRDRQLDTFILIMRHWSKVVVFGVQQARPFGGWICVCGRVCRWPWQGWVRIGWGLRLTTFKLLIIIPWLFSCTYNPTSVYTFVCTFLSCFCTIWELSIVIHKIFCILLAKYFYWPISQWLLSFLPYSLKI